MPRKQTILRIFTLSVVILGLPAIAGAQPGFSIADGSPGVPGPPLNGVVTTQGGQTCTFIDLEGIGDFTPIGTITGSPNVTFGADWVALVDTDAGGSGNFANEPSPDTGATFLDVDSAIDFDLGVQSMQLYYSAAANSIPVTLTAWDGPGGTGSVVDTAMGTTVGTDYDGADCSGDPGGNFCLWDTLTLDAGSDVIESITITGAQANFFGFDDMLYCTGALPVPAAPPSMLLLLAPLLVLMGLYWVRRSMA